MINILFVDDEPNILDGLQRMLRSMRTEWKMLFAGGGAEALNILGENSIDVVVSDMKMPGMDGAQLLKKVETEYPHTVRIILSGYSEQAMILKSVGTAHQYLSKPCDSEMLKEVVSRACALRGLLTDENLRRLVSKMHSVPSMPMQYQALLEELNREEPCVQKVGDIIKTDIGMTVKVLQIVNSAFFGLRRTISDANEAVRLLGLQTISSLALGVGVFSQFESKVNSGFLSNLWERSVVVAKTARQIAQIEKPDIANDAFTAGLLHDIGEVVLAINLPDQFMKAQELMEIEKLNKSVVERQTAVNSQSERVIYQNTHAHVGAYLLGLWGLPESIVEAVAFHHSPSDSKVTSFTPLTAVNIASVFHRHTREEIFDVEDGIFNTKYFEDLGLMNKIPFWYDKFMQPEN